MALENEIEEKQASPETAEIKYICFDIGNVTVYGGKIERLEKARERWGEDFSKADFKAMMKPDIGDGRDYWREVQNGQITSEEYLSAAVRGGNLEDTLEEREHFAECLRVFAGNPYQPMIDLAITLKEQGYHISVLTNNNEIMFYSPGSQITEHAEVVVSSHEAGISKPRKGIYEILLEKLGNPDPAEVLFVDDKKKNIAAAVDPHVGITGYLFRSREVSMDEAFEEFVDFLKSQGMKL